MNKWLLGLMVLALVCLASATPHVYTVATTPLYASAFNTLTCNFISNDSAATVQYRWYKDGIWYSTNTVTYSSLATGSVYKCAVNLSRGGSTGWQNSTNNVTVAASCVNPYPFMYKNIKGNLNITSFYSSYPFNIKVLGGDYKLLTNHNRVIENKTFIFLGGDYSEAGTATARDVWMYDDAFYGELFSGTMTALYGPATAVTDDNAATAFSCTPGAVLTYYAYLPKDTIAGTTIHIKLTLGAGAAISVQANNSGGWDTLASGTTDTNVLTTENYQNFRLVCTRHGVTTSSFYEVEVLNVSSGTITGAYSIPASFTPNNFTQTEGALYTWNYLNEETEAPFSLSSAGTLNSSELTVFCSSTVTNINTTGDALNKTYFLGLKENPSKIETSLEYDAGDTYFRRMVFCDNYDSFHWYLVDAAVTSPRLYTFVLNDLSGSYAGGSIMLKRYVDTVLDEITGDEWDASNQALFYLIDNKEYSINLRNSGCGSTRNIGWVTTNPSSTTYTLTVGGVSVNSTLIGMIYNNLYFHAYWDNKTHRVNCTFADVKNETEWFYWAVYDASNNSIAYSDNTTSWDYHGSYLANASKHYYVKITLSHPDGSVHTYYEGALNVFQKFFDFLEYEGEGVLGLKSETFFLFFALLIIALTGLMVGPISVGVGGILVALETITFSVFGWLPFYSGASTGLWPFILATVILIAVFIKYNKGGSQ